MQNPNQTPRRPGRSRAPRSRAAFAVAGLTAFLAACSGGRVVPGAAAPADPVTASVAVTSPAPTSPGPTPSGGAAPATTKAAGGCAAGGAALPAGADRVRTADLDGDGRDDSIWLGDQGERRILGVQTASGARFSTTFTSAAPQAASATAGRLGDGSAVVLLDTGRSVGLYLVTGCRVVTAQNAQGRAYVFDKGFTGFGTGAGCPKIGSTGRRLAGYLAKPDDSGQHFRVTRTTIRLTPGTRAAVNGTTTTLGTDLAASNPIVKTAQSVTCTGAAAHEPR